MTKKRYTERDIQDYLDGSFAGDKEEFESYIEQNSAMKDIFAVYSSLYALIKAEPREAAGFPLADRVLQRIQAKKE